MAHIYCVFVDFKCIVGVWGALDEISISHGRSQNFEEASSGNFPERTRQAIQHISRKSFR